MKKNIITAILIVGALFTLASCGKKKTEENPNATTTASSTPESSAPIVIDTVPIVTDPTVINSEYGWVNTSTLHVRPEPNTDKDAIGGLKQGERVKILGKEGDWYRIEHGAGVGYVSAQYISLSPDQNTPTDVTTTTTTTEVASE